MEYGKGIEMKECKGHITAQDKGRNVKFARQCLNRITDILLLFLSGGTPRKHVI